jgi:DNA-binding transcriptional regulator YhcF (GntR family)
MEFHKKEAIYLQIVEMVCENILTGRWEAGEKIPSIREFAVSIEVNPNTVLRAYGFLQEKEIIRMQRGVGYFVTESANEGTLAYMKSNFIQNDLPLFFRSINLLGISFDELRERCQQWEKDQGRDENKQ